MRPIVSGIIGAIVAHLLGRWLGRRFPVTPKEHTLAWYSRRYEWIEWVGNALILVGMGVGIWFYRAGQLPTNDPRGVAVGFVLAVLLPSAMLTLVCAVSPIHRFREYWDFQEMKHGVRNVFVLYLVVPVFSAALYGTVHLLLAGP